MAIQNHIYIDIYSAINSSFAAHCPWGKQEVHTYALLSKTHVASSFLKGVGVNFTALKITLGCIKHFLIIIV